jgi:hypothetical protein
MGPKVKVRGTSQIDDLNIGHRAIRDSGTYVLVPAFISAHAHVSKLLAPLSMLSLGAEEPAHPEPTCA